MEEDFSKNLSEQIRGTASEDIRIIRDITSEIRSRIDLRKKEVKELGLSNEAVQQIRKSLTQVNRIAEESFDFASQRVNVLESEDDLTKKRLNSLSTIIALERELKDLEKLKELEGVSTEAIKNFSKLQEPLEVLKGEAMGFSAEIKKALDTVKSIGESSEIRIVKQLETLTRNIPIIGGFFEDAYKNIDSDIRKQLSKTNALIEILESEGLLSDKNVVSKITPQVQKDIKEKYGFDIEKEVSGEKGADLTEKSQRFVKKDTKDIIKDATNIKSISSSLTSNFKTTLKSSAGLLGVITQIGALILKADNELVSIQKSFALSRLEALGLRNEFAEVANESGNINITATALLQTVNDLSTELGFVAKFSNDTLVTMTKLTTQVGLTAQEAAQLAAAAEISDQSFEDIYQNVLGASYELQRQAGVQFGLREILKAVSSVTGQVRANLGANPEAIARAVTEAKLFGAELDDIVGASKQLLQFEDSIRNELQAELLLERDLNLERARSAALMGDQETVAKELAAQAQDFTSFTKLNVLQQDALASSLGMQSDQLSDILFKQEVQNKTARDLTAAGKEDLAQRLEAQTLQDKFTATVLKLKALFVDVFAVAQPILQLFTDILYVVGEIIKLVEPLAGTISGAIAGFVGSGFNPLGALAGGLVGAASDINRSIDDRITPPANEGSMTDLFGDRSLSQMPDYQEVISKTNMVSPVINQGGAASTIQSAGTAINNQTSVNQDSEAFTSRLDKLETAINNQTKVLAAGQETIAKTKTKLTVGATDFGTELNINSFRIQ